MKFFKKERQEINDTYDKLNTSKLFTVKQINSALKYAGMRHRMGIDGYITRALIDKECKKIYILPEWQKGFIPFGYGRFERLLWQRLGGWRVVHSFSPSCMDGIIDKLRKGELEAAR